jgi:hypothetical protein
MPKQLEEQLHDEIDRIEDKTGEAQTIVDRAHASLGEALDLTGDPRDALSLLVELVEEDLMKTTSAAFRLGVSFAHEREKLA